MTIIPDPSSSAAPALAMAHVLFMDIVAYSKLPIDQQQKLLTELQEAVRNTRAFTRAHNDGKLISLPTGDGMALVFFDDPELPVRCAVQLSRTLRQHPEVKLRMGIHTGPVYRMADINAVRNVAGGGINIAQRVMDCGDAGHILVSYTVAELLNQISRWSDALRDLGETEVKHGVRLHIYNLYTDEAGNSELPQKLRTTQQSAAEPSRGKRKKLSLAIVAAGVVAALATGWFLYNRRLQTLTDKDTIVLSDFINTTGDGVFDDTLKQGLAVQLGQSPFLDLVSERKVNETLKLMNRSAGDRLTSEVTREVCQRTRSKAMLTGSITSLGSQYVVGLKAVNCYTGDVLAEAQEQAAGKEAVLTALDNAAVSLRGRLGESLSSVQKYATPLPEATTPSLEALKAYSLGLKADSAKGDTVALPFYKRAVELDPNFAAAYLTLSISYTNLNQAARAAENARRAYELREKVSERERLGIEGWYYMVATGELEKAAQVYELWEQTYPKDDSPYVNSSFIFVSLGNLEKSLEEAREAIRREPKLWVNYANLGASYANLNRLDEAEAVYKQAEERKLEGESLLEYRYQLAFLKSDPAKMGQLVAGAMGKPGTEDVLLAAQADTEAWRGKLNSARELTWRAMDSAQQNDARETAAAYQAAAALREVESGNQKKALGDADAAVKLAPNRDVLAMAALALARAGDTTTAEMLTTELDTTFPLNTVVQRYWLPTIRAAVALRRKDPSRAVQLLKVASTIELGSPTSSINVALCPAYLRGETYLALGDGGAARGEFQKFIDRYGLVVNFPWGALARLGLARAYVVQGDTAKAKAAYQNFLALWKDADPDVPVLKEAQAEYAKLQ